MKASDLSYDELWLPIARKEIASEIISGMRMSFPWHWAGTGQLTQGQQRISIPKSPSPPLGRLSCS